MPGFRRPSFTRWQWGDPGRRYLQFLDHSVNHKCICVNVTGLVRTKRKRENIIQTFPKRNFINQAMNLSKCQTEDTECNCNCQMSNVILDYLCFQLNNLVSPVGMPSILSYFKPERGEVYTTLFGLKSYMNRP